MTLREMLKKAARVRLPGDCEREFQANGILSFYGGQGQTLTTIIDQRRTRWSGLKEGVGGKNLLSHKYSYCIVTFLNDPSVPAGNANSDMTVSDDSKKS
jgi:hypothetical protein